MKRNKKSKRKYYNRTTANRSRLKKNIIIIVVVIGSILLLASIMQLTRYTLDIIEQRKNTERLKQTFNVQSDIEQVDLSGADDSSSDSYEVDESLYNIESGVFFDQAGFKSIENITVENNPPEVVYLPEQCYPLSPNAIILSRFQKLRRQNKDIIGWITINSIVDQAVVQRDNEYYLKRDSLGYHNANGALFLDENCDLSVRPYTYIIYGHNMKSGEMFGRLKEYERTTFYKNNPFIKFDTMHEDGDYVIFAASKIGIIPRMKNYIDIRELSICSITERKKSIEKFKELSAFQSNIDVKPEDQLLLLVTCIGNDDERFIVIARRIRENEEMSALQQIIQLSFHKQF